MKKKYNWRILVFVFLSFIFSNYSLSEVFIVAKINKNIITNVDIKNEEKYLMALNPNIKKLSENHSKPELVFAGYSELYLGKNEIEKKMSIYLDKIEDEGDNYIELINTYHENEINKKIEDVRNNYKAENV